MAKLIVANWKMNPANLKEARSIFTGSVSAAKKNTGHSVVMCLPFPFLFLGTMLSGKKIALGSQNTSHEISGAHTGEVSVSMLKSLKVQYCLIGHSESRSSGETNHVVNKKVLLTLKNKIIPILCIGESDRDHEGTYLSFLKTQIIECLTSVSKAHMGTVIIAYEPLWAIGEHAVREATAEEFTEIKIFIKKIISDIYDPKIAHSVKILYGGSVHPENAGEFVHRGFADGLLVGRDSLNPKKFAAILAAV